MTDKMIYLVQEERYDRSGGLEDIIISDEYICDSKEEANRQAEIAWNYLTKKEKESARVYVIKLKESDFIKVRDGECEEWYDDFSYNEDGFFDTKEEANGLFKVIHFEVKVQDIIDEFDEGSSVVRLELYKDGDVCILDGSEMNREECYEGALDVELLERGDYEECGDLDDYIYWLNDCFEDGIEVEDYLLKVEFI